MYECSGMTECLSSLVRLVAPRKYRQISNNKRYIHVKSFNNYEREEYKKAFVDNIYNGSIMLMAKIGNGCGIKRFLSGCFLDDSRSGYHIISNGIIKNNFESKVFPGLVEIGEWTQIGTDDVLLVVWGEGTAVFILEKPK